MAVHEVARKVYTDYQEAQRAIDVLTEDIRAGRYWIGEDVASANGVIRVALIGFQSPMGKGLYEVHPILIRLENALETWEYFLGQVMDKSGVVIFSTPVRPRRTEDA